MKRALLVLFMILTLSGAAWAQPKVAVLDALVQKGIDSSVAVPVTEKVIERLVVSGRYVVLDRANIEQVLREREFQVSGLVSDEDITAAGKYLGADLVVVVRVQKVAETYFVSSKMITVESGVIVNQSSAEGEGKLSVLIRLAEESGDVLCGNKAQERTAAEPAKAEPRETPPAKIKKRAPAQSQKVGTRTYLGFGGGTQSFDGNLYYYPNYESDGMELYAISEIWKGFCVLGNVAYLDAYTIDNGAAFLSADIGFGYARPSGIFMPWIGARVGYTFMDWPSKSLSYSDWEYGADLGADLRLGRFLLGVLYQLTASSFSESGLNELFVLQNNLYFLLGYKL